MLDDIYHLFISRLQGRYVLVSREMIGYINAHIMK